MRPFTQTIPIADARRIVLEAAKPITRRDTLAIDDADGRVVARAVLATEDVPPFDRAAMDGYAVVAAETTGASREAPIHLRCIERLHAGHGPRHPIGAGECAEIATGAMLPEGADAVIIVEDTDRATPEDILLFAPVSPRQNIGRRGADLARGQTVVREGQALSPAQIGALAATGITHVEVFAKPTVAILCTGDEIAEPGRPLSPGQIYDVNRFTVAAVANRHGGRAIPMPSVGDSLDALDAAMTAACTHDVVVFTGGSSVGERDLIVDVLKRRGEVLFHGVAVRPGKPTAFGHVDGTPVFAMPGYPTSCLSNAYMLLAPFLRRIARLPEWRPETMTLPLAKRVISAPGRHQFYTVRVADGAAEPAFKASGDITSMANADGYIEIPAETESVEAGMMVRVTMF